MPDYHSSAARAAGALVLAGAGALAWGALVEVRWYALRQVSVPVLPPGQEPLRVLHISDLHLTPTQRRKVDWVRDLATWRPHLVVDTGDNFAHPDGVPALLHAFEPLLAVPGAFVMGSNDYYAPVPKNPARYLTDDARDDAAPGRQRQPYEEMTAAFRAAGWRDLANRRDDVVVDGRTIALVGVDDAHLDRDRFPESTRTRQSRADLRLGVTHAPYRRILDAMPDDG